MLGRDKKIICGIILLLIVIEFGFITFGNIGAKMIKKELNEEKDNKTFALMIQQTEGEDDYEESDEDIWPSSGYKYNKDKSYCLYVDSKEDEKINDILDFEDGKAIVKTTKSVFCYLYFDIQKDINFTFYLGGETNPEYTKTQNIQLYIKTDNADVNEYCITNTTDSSSCTWKNISNLNYTLSSTNGTQTRYMFLRTKDGKVSEKYQSDEIILDDIPPTCSSVYIDLYNRVVFEYSDNLGLSDGNKYEIDIKDEVAAKTYYASTSDMAGNTCNYSKTIYNNNSGGTTYDLYTKSCYSNGFGSYQYAYQKYNTNVSVELCKGNIEYSKDLGYCNPNTTWCNGDDGSYGSFGKPSCYVCIANTTPASCPNGTSQIPGTNYCW